MATAKGANTYNRQNWEESVSYLIYFALKKEVLVTVVHSVQNEILHIPMEA